MNSVGRPQKDDAKPASIYARKYALRKERVSPEKWAEYLEKRRQYQRRFRDENRTLWRKQERECRMRYRRRKLAEIAGRPNPGKCDVCQSPKGPIVFDHCHASNEFRGWLCGNCNKTLGFAADNPERLRQLALYLEQGQKIN